MHTIRQNGHVKHFRLFGFEPRPKKKGTEREGNPLWANKKAHLIKTWKTNSRKMSREQRCRWLAAEQQKFYLGQFTELYNGRPKAKAAKTKK